MSGRVVDLAVVEFNPSTFYVASATGGVWKTTNNGVTFAPVFWREASHSVGAIVVHQRDTNVVWVGTGERANRQSSSWGDGVYRSTDGGRSWRNMGLRDSHIIGRIALHPANPRIVYVAAAGHLWGPNTERGLYKSDDAGEHWTRVLAIDENTGVVDVALDPSNPEIVYAASYQRQRRPYGFDGDGPGSGLHQSTDGGRTWRLLTNGLPTGEKGRIGITIFPRDPRIVYVSVEQGYRYNASTAYTTRRGGVYRSMDRGGTWTHMSDWNPRPMYASQIHVDPTDAGRVYMENEFSVSEDSGKTFRAPPQSLHGDDRILWVNPRDPRHLIKGDDGGLGISYDRGRTWLYATHLPLSQYYRISVDMQRPFNIYGGLQDNGSWAGPSATYRSEGILFEDWLHTGGGDGFANVIDTTDNRTLYNAMQYLGLQRYDLTTHLVRAIRPDNARGAIAARRNWDAWGPGHAEPELANAMAPANWDAPLILSPHDSRTLYAGTNVLWKSIDRGDTWTALGDLTTKVNRRDLLIMGARAHDSTASLDDGIPYYPTLTAIAESPLRRGLLYVGTDDGNLQVSRDGGSTWTNVADRMPGLPRDAEKRPWISGIEASRQAVGTVYVAINNYRNDDFTNYLYRSTDFGATWQSIASGLPAARVTRTIREDRRNAKVLYLGTELGLFYSLDAGASWQRFQANLPTVAVNDLLVHPRDNDLVIATHGRGLWILDNVNALQELTPAVVASAAHLFTIEPAEMIRYSDDRAHVGDMIFRGQNPPPGAIIDYYLRDAVSEDAIALTVHDVSGRLRRTLRPTRHAGVQRVVWDLREDALTTPTDTTRRGVPGPWVLPGRYTVRLQVGPRRLERIVTVRDDPRVRITAAERGDWMTAMRAIAALVKTHEATWTVLHAPKSSADSLAPDSSAKAAVARADEVRNRLLTLYTDVSGWPGRPTADQRAQMRYLAGWTHRIKLDSGQR